MKTTIEVEGFARENIEGIETALEFAKREAKGLPTDRLASTQELRGVAQGIRAQALIIACLFNIIQGASERC